MLFGFIEKHKMNRKVVVISKIAWLIESCKDKKGWEMYGYLVQLYIIAIYFIIIAKKLSFCLKFSNTSTIIKSMFKALA